MKISPACQAPHFITGKYLNQKRYEISAEGPLLIGQKHRCDVCRCGMNWMIL